MSCSAEKALEITAEAEFYAWNFPISYILLNADIYFYALAQKYACDG